MKKTEADQVMDFLRQRAIETGLIQDHDQPIQEQPKGLVMERPKGTYGLRDSQETSAMENEELTQEPNSLENKE